NAHPGSQQQDVTNGTSAGLQNQNTADQVIAMQRDKNTFKYATPKVHRDSNCAHQNCNASGLFKPRRYGEDAVELGRYQQPRAHDGKTYPKPDPESSRNGAAGFLVIFLSKSFGDEANYGALQSQIEQVHVRH